jgi:hypothetical protein
MMSDTPGTLPNNALLAALGAVEKIQRDMNPTKLSPTQEYLEEARSGAMYATAPQGGGGPPLTPLVYRLRLQ